MKVTIVGAGSTYTPELVYEMCKWPGLKPKEIRLMDIDPERLEIVGGFIRRVLAPEFSDVAVILTTDRKDSLKGTDFVITSIRPGGNKQRVFDERIPYEMDLFSSETIGPGGFAFALRAVPPMVEIARDMEKYAPDAWLINTTNPAGIITEAILKNTKAKVVGMCHGGLTILPHIAATFGVDLSRIGVRYAGLNHLGWIMGVYLDGKEVPRDEVAERFASEAERLQREVEFIGEPDLFRTWRWPLWSQDYRAFTFGWREIIKEIRAEGRVRAEDVVDIEAAMLGYMSTGSSIKGLIDATPGRGGSKIEQTRVFGPGGYAPGVLTCLRSLATDTPSILAVNVRNNGTISDLPDNVAVEVSSLVRRDTIWPFNVGHLPPEMRGLVQVYKAYEELTIEAAMTGSYEKGLKALTIHPMVGGYKVAKTLLDRYLEAHRDYLPLWSNDK